MRIALWAAQRAHERIKDSAFAFLRYNKCDQTNANSSRAALNKWMKPNVNEKGTMSSFSYSMRDRLRAVECPADVVNQIGGLQTKGVEHGYGTGYLLDV